MTRDERRSTGSIVIRDFPRGATTSQAVAWSAAPRHHSRNGEILPWTC